MSLPRSDSDQLKSLYSVAGNDWPRKSAVRELGWSLAKVAEIRVRAIHILSDLYDELEAAKSGATANIDAIQTRSGFSTNADSKKLLEEFQKTLDAT
jgi:hypothetical protein